MKHKPIKQTDKTGGRKPKLIQLITETAIVDGKKITYVKEIIQK